MKNLCLLLSAFCLVTSAAVAKDMDSGRSSRHSERHAEESDAPAWCGTVYTGGAFSMSAHVNYNSTEFNTPSGVVTTGCCETNNDCQDSNLGKMSSFIGLAVGRQIGWDWLHLGVSYEFYTPFQYNRYNTVPTALPTQVVGHEILSPYAYDRSFELNHQSAMLNLEFGLPRNWSWDVSCMNISPLLGVGLGVGVNKVTNFQAVGYNSGVASSTAGYPLQLTSLAVPHTKAALAWQVNAGLNFRPEDSDISFSLAYRFYEGGKFSTGSSYMLNDQLNSGAQVALDPFCGKLRTNQFVFALDFQF